MPPRILVVDDEPDILELTRLALTQDGFEVDVAATGNEALDQLRRARPDLVVLDLMLPDRPGTEICRAMRANPEQKDIPVIMLTARSDEVDRVVGFELGADDYVTKPYSPRELCLRVRAILRRGRPTETPTERLQKHGLLIDSERQAPCPRHRSRRALPPLVRSRRAPAWPWAVSTCLGGLLRRTPLRRTPLRRTPLRRMAPT